MKRIVHVRNKMSQELESIRLTWAWLSTSQLISIIENRTNNTLINIWTVSSVTETALSIQWFILLFSLSLFFSSFFFLFSYFSYFLSFLFFLFFFFLFSSFFFFFFFLCFLFFVFFYFLLFSFFLFFFFSFFLFFSSYSSYSFSYFCSFLLFLFSFPFFFSFFLFLFLFSFSFSYVGHVSVPDFVEISGKPEVFDRVRVTTCVDSTN